MAQTLTDALVDATERIENILVTIADQLGSLRDPLYELVDEQRQIRGTLRQLEETVNDIANRLSRS